MTRPTISDMDVTKTGWVDTINANFAKIFDAPFPVYLATDKATLDAINPGLYVNCIAIVATDSRLYLSDGTSWNLYDTKLDFVVDLVPGSATLADIKNAYNALLADMQSKGMMSTT